MLIHFGNDVECLTEIWETMGKEMVELCKHIEFVAVHKCPNIALLYLKKFFKMKCWLRYSRERAIQGEVCRSAYKC